MITETQQFSIANIEVEVVRKDIKNLHLGVYPPFGRVRVAAPLLLSDDAIRLAVIDKLSWIKRQQAQFEAQPRQSKREMVSGETHYYLGRGYLLQVHYHNAPAKLIVRGFTHFDIFVRPATTVEQREAILQRWYREQLKTLILPMLEKWQSILGIQSVNWDIKKMKTKWGSCNIAAARVWFNLELVKKHIQCIEYVVVHELAHFQERHHNEHFTTIMDRALPQWRELQQLLNSTPLAHENWKY